MTPDVDHDTLARWFGIYADAPGHVSITAFKDGSPRSHHYQTDRAGLDAAMAEAQTLTDSGFDVYMRTTTVDPDRLAVGQRGKAEHTAAVIGIGTDLDHGQGAHKRTDLPPTPDDALSLIDGMPPPTIVVNSGGGFYAWWLFDRPCVDLDLCAPLLTGWNQHIIEKGAERGWHVDQVGDLPRILRPVGTVSYKGGTATPVVVHEHTGLRYEPQQLAQWLADNTTVKAPEPAQRPLHPVAGDDDLTGRIRRRLSVHQELSERGVDIPRDGTIRCPFPGHDDHTPSFHIYDGDGGWACFGSSCPSDGGGSVIDLVMHLDGLDVADAIRYCARRIGEPQPEVGAPNLVAPPEQLVAAATQASVPATTDALPLDPAQLDPANPLHAAVLNEYVRGVARDHARQIVATQSAPPPPDFMRLDQMLQRPLSPVTYRIMGLWPARGRVMLVAQFKAGKTTMMGNVVRSLVDGVPFLGQFPVTPLDEGRTVAVIDDELDDQTLQRWFDEQGVVNSDRAHVACLRGKTSTFNIVNPSVRSAWAAKLRAVAAQVVIFDCLRPVLDACGLSEHTEAGVLLNAFDELLEEAGVDEAIVVHHMGHGSERGRGDSRLRDWPDAEWKIVRDADQDEDAPDALRFFSAYGRDVDEKERRLELTGRKLTLSGGNRKDEKQRGEALTVVARLQGMGGEATFNQLKAALTFGVPKSKRVIELAVREGWVETVEGPTQAVIHRLTPKGEKA